jgi:hypothetical protein
VLNNEDAMVKLKRASRKRGKALVDISRNKWRHKHLLCKVFSKVLENHFPKGYKIVVL